MTGCHSVVSPSRAPMSSDVQSDGFTLSEGVNASAASARGRGARDRVARATAACGAALGVGRLAGCFLPAGRLPSGGRA